MKIGCATNEVNARRRDEDREEGRNCRLFVGQMYTHTSTYIRTHLYTFYVNARTKKSPFVNFLSLLRQN